ncbi:MAG: hypothetical protein DMG21_21555 [Acidobacteria bacterium]|nr:MAG: hypothetical protein DMG21_21555 [Acidobacteriota bacterium]
MPFQVYILRSQSSGHCYIGHTENLARREALNSARFAGRAACQCARIERSEAAGNLANRGHKYRVGEIPRRFTRS